ASDSSSANHSFPGTPHHSSTTFAATLSTKVCGHFINIASLYPWKRRYTSCDTSSRSVEGRPQSHRRTAVSQLEVKDRLVAGEATTVTGARALTRPSFIAAVPLL